MPAIRAPHGEVTLTVHASRHALPLAVALVLVSASAAVAAPPRAAAKPAAAEKPAAAPEARQALIIEGDDHLFMIAAPKGWVLDDTAGMGSRIRCVFYPKGQSWATASTVMYVNPLHGFGAKARTLSALVADDEKAFRQRSPRGAVTEGGTINTTGKKSARVRYFAEAGGQPHEAVAYVPDEDLVMLLVLSSRTPEGFKQALGAYHQLVESYAYVGANKALGR